MLPHHSSSFDGVRIYVHVKPFSSVSSVGSTRPDGLLEVSVAGRLKDGEANAELCRCLSHFFDIPKSRVIIESGHKSRNKVVLLQGMLLEDVEDKLLNGIKEKEDSKKEKQVPQG